MFWLRICGTLAHLEGAIAPLDGEEQLEGIVGMQVLDRVVVVAIQH